MIGAAVGPRRRGGGGFLRAFCVALIGTQATVMLRGIVLWVRERAARAVQRKLPSPI